MNFYRIFAAFSVLCSINHVKGTSNSTKKRASEDYYQVNYDYEVFNTNSSLGVEFSSDSLILPMPEDTTKENVVNTVASEDGNDADLKDHDFIDNLMYVYYGSGNKNGRRLYASEIIIGGSVLSCVAQISTILLVLAKKDINAKKDLKEIFLHMMCSFCVTNVAFMFGIFKTKHFVECLMVALFLTYFHLITAVWIFLYCLHIYKLFCKSERLKRKYFYLYGYGVPLLFLLVSFLMAPQTYETRKFCFMSVQRGMILNYMIPVFCLMILTATFCIKGIQKFNIELHRLQSNSNIDTLTLYNNQMEVMMGKKCGNIDAVNLRGSKSCLRRLCAMQTTYDIVWFFLVLGLENIRESSSMAVVYAFMACCLLRHWFHFLNEFDYQPEIGSIGSEIIKTMKKRTSYPTRFVNSFFQLSLLPPFINPLKVSILLETQLFENWYIFAELKIFFPTANKPNLKEVTVDAPKRCNGLEMTDSSPTSSECKQGSSDSVPLLIESTELKVLHHNPNISTISN